jgi:DNA-binding NarL/FixJ family response regulator
MNLRVLIAEDHENTRKSISYGLKTFGEMTSLAEVDNGFHAVEYVKKYHPDVVLMDIAMPIMNGIEATMEIKKIDPEVKVIMLTSISDKENVLAAFASGANAYCTKSIKINDLLSVIKTVMDGAVWMDPHIAGFVLDFIHSKQTAAPSEHQNDFNLTAREKEILKFISDGLCNKDIAEKLFLSLHTVKNHVRNIIQKLSVEDRTQAAVLALKENLI